MEHARADLHPSVADPVMVEVPYGHFVASGKAIDVDELLEVQREMGWEETSFVPGKALARKAECKSNGHWSQAYLRL